MYLKVEGEGVKGEGTCRGSSNLANGVSLIALIAREGRGAYIFYHIFTFPHFLRPATFFVHPRHFDEPPHCILTLSLDIIILNSNTALLQIKVE